MTVSALITGTSDATPLAAARVHRHFTHVSPPAASVCEYAQCATRLEAANSETIPRSSSAFLIWSPNRVFRSVHDSRCSLHRSTVARNALRVMGLSEQVTRLVGSTLMTY